MDVAIAGQDREVIAGGLSPAARGRRHALSEHAPFPLERHRPDFNSLHLVFKARDIERALEVDEIATRIRAFFFLAPFSYPTYANGSPWHVEDGVPKAAQPHDEQDAERSRLARRRPFEHCRTDMRTAVANGPPSDTDHLPTRRAT